MEPSRRATRYDLFKLIVAILLLIFFLILIRRPNSPPLTPALPTQTPRPASSATVEANSIVATSTRRPPTESAIGTSSPAHTIQPTTTLHPSPTGTTLSATATDISSPTPTGTNEPAPTESLPSPTATSDEILSATPLPSPTRTPMIEPTPSPTGTAMIEPTSTPVGETRSSVSACEAALSRSRLQSGRNATILRRLNFRSSPGIRDNWLRTNIPGTQVQVIGGPECLPHVSGAYVWWQIRLPDGEVGWSAEGSVHGTFYFIQPGE